MNFGQLKNNKVSLIDIKFNQKQMIENSKIMAKSKTLDKKQFDFNSLKEKFSSKAKFKPDRYLNCGEAFYKSCGVPGPAVNAINMFLGHSNTSKTTALVLAAVDAQKQGMLPVFLITENKWSFPHAKELGLDCQNEDGEWDGFFLFRNDFDYIEQITDYINSLIDAQEKGDLPYSLVFFWDSVGSIPSQMTFEGRGSIMKNAQVLAEKVGMGIHGRITKTKRFDSPYDNTMVIINQPWVQMPDNPFGQATIKAKGGEALWLASSLIFLFGNQKSAGVSYITATKGGRTVSYATRTKITILKNHITGLGYKDSKILATPHGFILDMKEEVEKYKKEYSQYWNGILEGSGEISFSEEEGED
jgi:hypothetical protein